jgi:predicted amidophosphoribosyltransferase
MAGQMAANAPRLPTDAPVVPVPPSRRRLRERGFDPAALLARGFAERTGRELQPLLRRRDRAPRQVGAGRAERRVEGRMRIEATAVAPRCVILLDDVHTTGATLRACAAALRRAGAEEVRAVTYARTP